MAYSRYGLSPIKEQGQDSDVANKQPQRECKWRQLERSYTCSAHTVPHKRCSAPPTIIIIVIIQQAAAVIAIIIIVAVERIIIIITVIIITQVQHGAIIITVVVQVTEGIICKDGG